MSSASRSRYGFGMKWGKMSSMERPRRRPRPYASAGPDGKASRNVASASREWIPIELVVHAERHHVIALADGLRLHGADRRRRVGERDGRVAEVDILVFAGDRPARVEG